MHSQDSEKPPSNPLLFYTKKYDIIANIFP